MDQGPPKLTVTLTLKCTPDALENLVTPYFRFEFVNSHRCQTAPFLAGGAFAGADDGEDYNNNNDEGDDSPGRWERLFDPADASAGTSTSNPALGDGSNAEAPGDADLALDSARDEDVPVGPPPQLRWSRDFELDTDGDSVALALSINADPNVVFMLADKSTPLPPASGDTDNNNNTAADGAAAAADNDDGDESKRLARPFLSMLPLDVSPLLAGDTSVSVTYANSDGSKEARGWAPPPVFAGAKCSCFESLTVEVSANRPLFQAPQVSEQINPLTLTILSARPLPGLTVERDNPTMAKYVTPTPFTLLERLCGPVYASLRLFPGKNDGTEPASDVGQGRVVRTVALPQGIRKARWKHRTVFLVGEATGIDRDKLAEELENTPVSVYVHDRDVQRTTDECLNDATRWCAMLNDGGNGGDQPSTEEKDEGGADGDGDGGDNGQASPRTEVSVFDVDKVAWREDCERVLNNGAEGCLCTHGRAKFRLDDLLSSANEVLRRYRAVRRDGADDAHLPPICEKLRASVVQVKRRIERGGDAEVAELDLTDEERLVRMPADYLATGTEVVLTASLRHPIHMHRLSTFATTAAWQRASQPQGTAAPMASAPPPSKEEEGVGSDGEPGEDGGAEDGAPARQESQSRASGASKGGGAAADPAEVAERALAFAESTMGADSLGLPCPEGTDRLQFLASTRLQRQARNPVFQRAVFCFKYKNAKIMQALRAVLVKVNTRALPGVSVRSYQLSDEEIVRANSGSLDILTGFQVVDDEFRVIVMEGLGLGGMRELLNGVPRELANHPRCKIFTNPALRFTKRLYTQFHVDLKIIHLRDPLPAIVRSPDIYNRVKVSEQCFEALNRLSEIRSANRLKDLMRGDIFPTVEQLVRLESKYGEAVSTEDIEGVPKTASSRGGSRRLRSRARSDAEEQKQALAEKMRHQRKFRAETSKVSFRTKAATDSNNPEFEAAKKAWKARDYLSEHRSTRREVVREAMRRRMERDSTPLDPDGLHGGEVFIYSGQKMQYTDWEKEQMRQKLAKDKRATYTYSNEYQSLAVCLVNEEEMTRQAELDSRKKFTTQRGFVYPAPRKPSEYSRHPKQVSEARKADLNDAWIENLFHPKPVARASNLKDGQEDFDCIPVTGMEFGGYNNDGTKNTTDWNRSVHLMTEDEAAEAEYERKVKAKEEWESKVIVDNVRFNPHYGVRGDHPCQLDKLNDILQGKANHKGIRIVQKARLPSGKAVPLKPPPATIFADDEYEDPVDFTTTLKPNIMEEMYGTDANGNKVNFRRFFHRDDGKPMSQRIKYSRKSMPMNAGEKTGPKWSPVPRISTKPKN